MEVFNGVFSNWNDVKKAFRISDSKPDIVFYASYDQDGYDGMAEVYYRKGNKYYEVVGSHCSCYNLEECWNPEEFDRETFLKYLRKTKKFHVIEAIHELEEFK